MTTLKVLALFCNLLFAYTALGKEVQLSSNLVEQDAGQIAACVYEQVIFECTGNNMQYMRWAMEPFVNRSNPVTFNFEHDEGCLPKSSYDQLEFCLIYKSRSPDSGTRANMTSTLTFVAVETLNGIPLNGTIVMCNEKNLTLQIIKDPPPPPPLSDLNCNILRDDPLCYDFNFALVCTWTPLPEHQISSYKFNITSALYGQLSPQTVAANESSLKFIMMCSDTIIIAVFGMNKCNVAGKSSSKLIPANCSECYNVIHSQRTIAITAILDVIVGIVVGVIGACCYSHRNRLSFLLVKPSNIKITWTKCEDFPVKMSHMHVVKIGDRLYCGGGYTGKSNTVNKVFTCTCIGTRLGEWKELSGRCPVIRFALTYYTIEGEVKLVTVGGIEVDRIYNEASILATEMFVRSTDSENENEQWKKGLSKLYEPKLYPAALNYRVGYKEFIIACGGIPNVCDTDIYHADTFPSTDTVEIYNGQNWSYLNHLPFKRNSQSLTNIDQKFYIVGGGSQQSVNNDAAMIVFTSMNSEWERIQSCPLAGSTAIGIQDQLLVIGGHKNMKWPWSSFWTPEAKQSIYAFNKGKWDKVQVNGTVPRGYMAAVKKLSKEEFILIGGQRANNVPEASVYIGTVKST